MRLPLFLALLACLFFPIISQAAVYQWVDENGVTHFSQTPPENARFNVIDTKDTYPGGQQQPEPTPPAAPTVNPNQPAESEQQVIEVTENKPSQEKCDLVAKEIEQLKTLPRIRLKTGDTYKRLTDEEKKAMIDERIAWHKKYCQ